ncbi:MAG: SAM-dependent methyltransferase [Candidatus Omnitrophota bacterium]|jgi:MinD-like ATPase involved in chromosome partitioning or flagellar assembly|nr:MAG: SAM-dependent methyltransferase [Candidatus Omnitrophota bacterium]
MTLARERSSFRDPCGFLFTHEGILYRQINNRYRENYDHLIHGGLYDELVKENLLLPHRETDKVQIDFPDAYKIIQPEKINFISYPYEWSFSQLKDAAELTLQIQRIAMDYGMSLKDGSAYNIQFHKGKPVFIDTLSFEILDERKPWIAYRQFCQHFLAPLALMSYVDPQLNTLLVNHIDGIPLDLCHKLLPFSTRFRFSLFTHIHLHARFQKQYETRKLAHARRESSQQSMRAIVDNLQAAVRKLTWIPSSTAFSDYYSQTNYSSHSFEQKKEIIESWIKRYSPRIVWDMGANDGLFSRIAASHASLVLSIDNDPAAIENNYRMCKAEHVTNILPLFINVTNPSPAIGWDNQERKSLGERGPADLALALALIHHLAISNNLPLSHVAAFFSRTTHRLVIEFVPKEDSQVQRLLQNREDIFTDYNQKIFEQEFSNWFTILEKVPIAQTTRTLYCMERLP